MKQKYVQPSIRITIERTRQTDRRATFYDRSTRRIWIGKTWPFWPLHFVHEKEMWRRRVTKDSSRLLIIDETGSIRVGMGNCCRSNICWLFDGRHLKLRSGQRQVDGLGERREQGGGNREQETESNRTVTVTVTEQDRSSQNDGEKKADSG